MCRFFEKLFGALPSYFKQAVGSVGKVSESKAWVEPWYYYTSLFLVWLWESYSTSLCLPSRKLDPLYSYLIRWCEGSMNHLYEPQDVAQGKYFRIVRCCSFHYYSNFPYTINFTSWTVILLLIYLGPLVCSGICEFIDSSHHPLITSQFW